MTALSEQATLNVQLRDDATFTNYIAEKNQQVLAYLTKTLSVPNAEFTSKQHQFIYLWGAPGERAGLGL